MANSLLAHLYSRIRGSQEDVATLAIHYLLSQSDELNKAFTHLLASHMETKIDDVLVYSCQVTGEEKSAPTWLELILTEMKNSCVK